MGNKSSQKRFIQRQPSFQWHNPPSSGHKQDQRQVDLNSYEIVLQIIFVSQFTQSISNISRECVWCAVVPNLGPGDPWGLWSVSKGSMNSLLSPSPLFASVCRKKDKDVLNIISVLLRTQARLRRGHRDPWQPFLYRDLGGD